MTPARATAEDSIPFQIASPVVVSATEAARVRPAAPAHDSFTRLLHRLEPDPDTLGAEVRSLGGRGTGVRGAARWEVIRGAVRRYLRRPPDRLPDPTTA